MKKKNRPAIKQAPEIKFTATEIVLRSPDDLVAFPNNPKIHTPEQIDAISASIKAFGFDQPILIDEDDTVLKGHGRRLAARKIGVMVPTIVRKGLTPAQKWAVVISDNSLPAMTGFDKGLLKIGLTTLAKLDYPLHLTGFDQVRLATFGVGAAAGQSDPDEEQTPEPDAVSRLGDVWLLGNHRILCGDSTKKEDVAKVLGKDKPHLMVTDPPYGVEYDPTWSDGGAKMKRATKGTAPNKALGVVRNDKRADWREAWVLFPGDVVYAWCSGTRSPEAALALEAAGFVIRNLIIWAKGSLVISRGDYHHQHEPCWYAVRKGKTGHWAGDRKQSTIWNISKPQKNETGHSTQKPVECMKRPIENNSKQGDSIYEPFAGSGTTIIAAEMTSRACLAIEIDPSHVDLCVRRWMKFSGQKATLQGSKKTFDQIEKERSKIAA